MTTEWHSQWALPVRVAEPGRTIKYIYNGRPDPETPGGPAASCAPATAMLPDGTPIAVLCKEIELATTDADGSLGFAAPIQAGVAAREQSWVYDENGQVASHDGPRTDVADVTTYEYYAANSASFGGTPSPSDVGYTKGDLKKVTDPASNYVEYTLYNRTGQPLESKDRNNVVTTYGYDARQRPTRRTVGSASTTWDYWPTGLVKTITRPDSSWTFYEHDDAHRLFRVSDNLGNSVTYTLDNLGNRKEESVKGSGNALRRLLSRDVDALGRIERVTGRE